MNKYTLDYVKFFIFRNGIGHFPDEDEIKDRTYNNPRIKEIIQNLQNWPGISLKTHKSADHPLHKLAFLAELGFTRHDPGISDIVDKIFQLQSKEGPFQIRLNIPVHFGGSGDDQLSWMLCDATVLVYALISLNGDFTPSIRQAIQYMTNLMNDNGWPCAAAREFPGFRGPGRKGDPCPYVTMFALKMLSLTGPNEYESEKSAGINSVFRLWDMRRKIKPFLFAMGTDFQKLKLPFVWYDILNMTDTLSRFPAAIADPRFSEMWEMIARKKNSHGYIPESVYLKMKKWDFGQKKAPSEFMNAIIERIEMRINQWQTIL